MNDIDDAGQFEGDVTAAMVRVVRGVPDDIELAALVAGIVAARAAAPGSPTAAPAVTPWDDHGRRLGHRAPGPGAWRWSLHP
ncbi:acyl-CoA carboxylase subunit epsilon [Georgenia sp. MJ170]|uniref:acyl-CoA carboxylase subunit epsilon n=1 Tax=Georgenia sunbinii TaxID=3117728 RepID=UPI002F265EAA